MSIINKFTISKVKIIDLIMYNVGPFQHWELKDIPNNYFHAMCPMTFKNLKSQNIS